MAKKAAKAAEYKQTGQMVRISDAAADVITKMSDRHGVSRVVFIERVSRWIDSLDHEGQQLVLGTLAPDRMADTAKRIAAANGAKV